MEKITVIIPIYNVEKYLKKCVNSVLQQTYFNLEVILVDDGSPDGCPAICDELARSDSRIRVIHKENGGLSSARNAGTAVASGDFIFYLDSDDYLEADALKSMLDVQLETDADVVVGNYFYTYENHEDLAVPAHGVIKQLSNPEAMEQLVTGKIQTFAWGKLIRREIAQKYDFPVGRLFEDHFWTHLIFADARKVTVTDKPLVHYFQRSESISYCFDLKRLDILDGWRAKQEFLAAQYPELQVTYLEHVVTWLLGLSWLCLIKMNADRRAAFRKIQKFSKDINLVRYAHGYNRAQLSAIQMGRLFYFPVAAGGKVFQRLMR